jgi:hypothetical protein
MVPSPELPKHIVDERGWIRDDNCDERGAKLVRKGSVAFRRE